MRVFFTGGSGKAGRHAIRHLVEQGHRVVNGDLVPSGHSGVADLRIDLTDAGQVFNALSAYAGFDELEPGTGVPTYDAVVHFAAIPAILVRPDNETFRINVLSTYNVIDAALKLGIRKVIFASSETTYGICFADGEVKPEYVPIDEEHPTVPHDSYAMSKVVNEATARSFQARTGADIYGLRINNVIEPHEYQTNFPAFVANPGLRRRRPHPRQQRRPGKTPPGVIGRFRDSPTVIPAKATLSRRHPNRHPGEGRDPAPDGITRTDHHTRPPPSINLLFTGAG